MSGVEYQEKVLKRFFTPNVSQKTYKGRLDQEGIPEILKLVCQELAPPELFQEQLILNKKGRDAGEALLSSRFAVEEGEVLFLEGSFLPREKERAPDEHEEQAHRFRLLGQLSFESWKKRQEMWFRARFFRPELEEFEISPELLFDVWSIDSVSFRFCLKELAVRGGFSSMLLAPRVERSLLFDLMNGEFVLQLESDAGGGFDQSPISDQKVQFFVNLLEKLSTNN